MIYKNIIENGHLVEVKLFEENEIPSKTEEKVKQFFDKENKNGYVFLKSYKENNKINTLFIKKVDYSKLCL